MSDRQFRKFDSTHVDDVSAYIERYVEEHPHATVFIGSDSQVRAGRIVFATAVCLYRPNRGAHVLYAKTVKQRDEVHSLHQRLMLEVSDTISLALTLRETLSTGIALEVHFDISPDDDDRSNVAYGSAVSYARGSDLQVKTKPAAASFAASCVADRLC